MRLSLHEVLAVVGRLDDAPGVDTPRDRFRRFLLDHMTTVSVARAFLDEAQQLLSEQYQRALQDTVAATGQMLGFEVVFGRYERNGAAARAAGLWRSRRRLIVDVRLFSDDAARDETAVAMSFDDPIGIDVDAPCMHLAVVTAACSSRPRIEDVAAARQSHTRVLSAKALVELVGAAASTYITHDDLLGVLGSHPSLDGLARLMTRMAHHARVAPEVTAPVVKSGTPPARWVYVLRDGDAEMIDRLASAGALQITVPVDDASPIETGDGVAFLAPARGVVARASVAAVEPMASEDGGGDGALMRAFSLRLSAIDVFAEPRAVETEQRLNLELQAAVSREPWVRVGSSEFLLLAGDAAGAS